MSDFDNIQKNIILQIVKNIHSQDELDRFIQRNIEFYHESSEFKKLVKEQRYKIIKEKNSI